MTRISAKFMDEINLVEYWKIIHKRKWMILLIVAITTSAMGLYSLSLPSIYRASTILLPLGQDTGFNLAAGALGTMFPALGGLGAKANNQLLVLLQSRSLSEEVVKKYGLDTKMFPPGTGLQNAAAGIKNLCQFISDPILDTITIQVDHTDPSLAAYLANAYVDILKERINTNTYTSAKRNRIFVEKQLAKNKAQLLENGKLLSEFYGSNKVSSINPRLTVKLEQEEPPSEVSNDGSPSLEITKLQKEQTALEKQLELQQVVKDVPQQVYLQHLTLRYKILEQINALLANQYELAKIDESREELGFEVIDPARPPKGKFKPHRFRMVLVSFVMSTFGAIFLAFIIEYFKNVKRQSP